MKDMTVAVFLFACTLATLGCHNEEDCGGQVLPKGVELEVTLTGAVSEEGCDGLGASLGSELRHVIGDPVDVGAHNKCVTETFEPPAAGELYGVTIDSCVPRRGGFDCQGSLLACPSQRGWVEVRASFRDLPGTGSESSGLYVIDVIADAQGDCAAVICRQVFDAAIKRL